MTRWFTRLKFRMENDDISPERRKRGALMGLASGCLVGLGYILQKSFVKGFAYMAIEVAYILFMVFWGANAINGLITLGSVPLRDHSLMLMVYGFIAVIVTGGFLCFWGAQIMGTYKEYIKKSNEHYEPKTRKEEFRIWLHEHTAIFFMLPGLVAISMGILLPLIFSISIGFTNYDANHQPPGHILEWVGFRNFKDLLAIGSAAKTFFMVLGWTIVWTVCASVLPYALDIILAVLLNNPKVKCKKIFKLIYILPWAIPAYISLLVLQSMFDTGYGLINQLFALINIPKVPWLTNTNTARLALILISVWTGFSFPMMLSENIIKNISKDIVEAATLDGASPTRIFISITLPLLFFSISPLFIMNFAGAFNNFNLIYLVTEGGPGGVLSGYTLGAGTTDILISWLYKLTTDQMKYNYGAALSLILFILIAAFSIFNLRRTRAFKEEDTMQ